MSVALTAARQTPDFGTSFAAYANPAHPRVADPASLHSLTGSAMGTTWSVKFVNPSMRALHEVRSAVEQALALVVAQMSTWEPDSSLNRYNRASPDSWHALEPELHAVLDCALVWASASGGACDPTIGPLVDLWGFGPRDKALPHAALPPPAGALAHAHARVGWQRVLREPDKRRVQQPGGVALDLSGVAKGFSVDLVVLALARMGLSHCLVDVGGELRASGRRPGGQPWRVAIARPDQSGANSPCSLSLCDMAIATSGDAWHFVEHEGRRYAHTIDPRSGAPVTHGLASVSVLHTSCMHADALATTLTVLGPEDGFAFACRHGLAAMFVERAVGGASPWRTRTTSEFERLAQ